VPNQKHILEGGFITVVELSIGASLFMIMPGKPGQA